MSSSLPFLPLNCAVRPHKDTTAGWKREKTKPPLFGCRCAATDAVRFVVPDKGSTACRKEGDIMPSDWAQYLLEESLAESCNVENAKVREHYRSEGVQ